MADTTTTNLSLSGLASGFDWQSLVDQLTQVEREPETALRTTQTTLQQRNAAYGNIVTEMLALKDKADALKSSTLYTTRGTTVGDDSILSAAAAAGTAAGVYAFNITQLASAATLAGSADAGGQLSATNDVSALILGDAGFATTIAAGKFTVNGQQITIATTDTLQQVFDKISAATGGAVTGSYDSTTDKITLSSASTITLGSVADTSNFLQATGLYNTGTGTVTSVDRLGAVKVGSTLANANFATPITGDGSFTINGVTINYSAATDTVNDVLARINNSGAGVIASFDRVNDRFVLTNASAGDLGIALQDLTGNFLAATGLASGSLTRGTNLLYTLNGGGQRVSYSNTIADTSSGVTGLSVTALTTGSTTVSVGSDTTDLKTAITDFVDEYNKVQSLIDSQTASSTDNQGNVTAGLLAGDHDIANVASQLRSDLYGQISGLSGTIDQLAKLGFTTNGTDNSIKLSDSTALDNALATNLAGVQDLFANATKGMAVTLSSYLDSTAGDNGSLVAHQNLLTQQSKSIDDQIAAMERIVLAKRQQMIDEFVAMEQAQAQINQQLQFLSERFGASS